MRLNENEAPPSLNWSENGQKCNDVDAKDRGFYNPLLEGPVVSPALRRKCLDCREDFHPTWKTNYVCKPCKKKQANEASLKGHSERWR